jgi:hypothetical protein
MGLQWMMDIRAKKPKPTNTAPGLIYMLCGATQHSNSDPFDRTSPNTLERPLCSWSTGSNGGQDTSARKRGPTPYDDQVDGTDQAIDSVNFGGLRYDLPGTPLWPGGFAGWPSDPGHKCRQVGLFSS